MTFWGYLLLLADKGFYVGHSENLEQRPAEHERGEIPGYTFRRRPVRLVWSETFLTRDEAFRCERQIKGWSRARKEALIRGDWETIKELARSGGSDPG